MRSAWLSASSLSPSFPLLRLVFLAQLLGGVKCQALTEGQVVLLTVRAVVAGVASSFDWGVPFFSGAGQMQDGVLWRHKMQSSNTCAAAP
jgi:hypothetical protein